MLPLVLLGTKSICFDPVAISTSLVNDVTPLKRKLPFTLMLPVPLMVLLLRSKLPPSCGVVSLITSADAAVTVTTPAVAEDTESPEPKLIVPAVPTILSLSSTMTSVPPPPPPPQEMRVAVIPVILPSATVICGDTVEPP